MPTESHEPHSADAAVPHDPDPVLDAVDPALAGITDGFVEQRLRQSLAAAGYLYQQPSRQADGNAGDHNDGTGGPVDAQEAEQYWETAEMLASYSDDDAILSENEPVPSTTSADTDADTVISEARREAQEILIQACEEAQRIRDEANADAAGIRIKAFGEALQMKDNAAWAVQQCNERRLFPAR